MAESVDALVSNTSGVTSIPVRPRVWVLKREVQENFSFFVYTLSYSAHNHHPGNRINVIHNHPRK